MKIYIYTVVIVALLSGTVYSGELFSMSKIAKKAFYAFESDPSKDNFDLAKSTAEKMIEYDPTEARGYRALIRLYSSESYLLYDEGCDQCSLVVSIVDRYMKVPGRKSDLSQARMNAIAVREAKEDLAASRLEMEEFKAKEEMRKWYAKKPSCVVASRKLIDEYVAKVTDGIESGDELDRAETILKKGLSEDPLNYKIYLGLFDICMTRADYARAYVMWKLAVSFGASVEDNSVINASATLYCEARNYEVNHDISKSNPGYSPDLYFLWLERETFSQYIDEAGLIDLNSAFEDSKKQRKQRSGSSRQDKPGVPGFRNCK